MEVFGILKVLSYVKPYPHEEASTDDRCSVVKHSTTGMDHFSQLKWVKSGFHLLLTVPRVYSTTDRQ
jgi:hypothetical protein